MYFSRWLRKHIWLFYILFHNAELSLIFNPAMFWNDVLIAITHAILRCSIRSICIFVYLVSKTWGLIAVTSTERYHLMIVWCEPAMAIFRCIRDSISDGFCKEWLHGFEDKLVEVWRSKIREILAWNWCADNRNIDFNEWPYIDWCPVIKGIFGGCKDFDGIQPYYAKLTC